MMSRGLCHPIIPSMPTWDAQQYLRFNDERKRPCRELANRVAIESPHRVIDLGCGPGNSTAVVAERWPKAELAGLDSSLEMIAAAKSSEPKRHWRIGDITAWAAPEGGLLRTQVHDAAGAVSAVGQHEFLD